MEDSPDVKTAVSRVRESRANRDAQRASLFPSLDGGGSGNARRSRTDIAGTSSSNGYSAGLDASWEVDLFGRNRSSVEAATANLGAAGENLNSVYAALAAEIAATYTTLRANEAKLAVLEQNITTREETAQLAGWRLKAGEADSLEATQSQSSLESARAGMPSLKQAISQGKNDLALLAGKPPGGLDRLLARSRGIPTPPSSLAVGIPADVLRQRPDVRTAGYQVLAAAASTRVTEATKYPSLNLSGSLGLDTITSSNLFDPESAAASVAANLASPIFDAGRIKANIEAARASEEQAVLNYQKVVLTALRKPKTPSSPAAAPLSASPPWEKPRSSPASPTKSRDSATRRVKSTSSMCWIPSARCWPWRTACSPPAPTARPLISDSIRRWAAAGPPAPDPGSRIPTPFHFMKPYDSSEDLATIVASGASRPMRKWVFLTIGTALIGGGVFYFMTRDKKGEKQADYETEEAKTGRISLIVTAAGNLAPTNQIIVGSELSGTAKEVMVDTNDQVKKGDTLAKLDTSKLDQQTERSRAALLAAKARVSQAEATLAETRAALARQEELLKISGGKTPSRATMETSRATVSRAQADLESAKATVTGAEAEVRSFESDLAKTVIRSPVDGIVLSRSIEVGQTVAASFTAPTLFTIAEDLKKMELLVNVSEADIGRIEAGQTATFSVDAWPARNYTAKVKKVAFGAVGTGTTASSGSSSGSNASASSVVTYSTELEVTNEDLSLRPGMTATVDIAIVDKPDILVVPNAALRFDPVAAAAIGKPDDTKRTLVQSLSPGGGRRWRGTPPPKAGSADSAPKVWTLKNGEPSGINVTPGITDGRLTEISGGNLTAGTPLIISIKPPKPE